MPEIDLDIGWLNDSLRWAFERGKLFFLIIRGTNNRINY